MRRIAVRVGAIMLLAITAACTREPLQGRAGGEGSQRGTSTDPSIFIRFFPAFCFSSSFRFRVTSPP